MPALQATEKCHHDLYDAVDPEKALSGTVRGLNVLVSGASRGAGKAIALAFSVAGAANLFLTARSEDALQETVKEIAAANPSCKCFCYPVDLGRASVDEAFEKISKDAKGKVDVLVSSAGIMEDHHLIADTDSAAWWQVWEVNLRGLYLMAKAVLPSMLASGGGTIINVASIGGIATRGGVSAYQGSKTAAIRFTDHLDTEHGSQGIRTYALHPGNMLTDMALTKMPKETHDTVFIDSPRLAGGISVYLATSKADFLKGRYIAANWDVTELEERKDEIMEKNLFKLQLAM